MTEIRKILFGFHIKTIDKEENRKEKLIFDKTAVFSCCFICSLIFLFLIWELSKPKKTAESRS